MSVGPSVSIAPSRYTAKGNGNGNGNGRDMAYANEVNGSKNGRNGHGNGNGGMYHKAMRKQDILREPEDAEMEARMGMFWHNMDLATAPPPAIGQFTGGFRTTPFVGIGGTVSAIADDKVCRLSIEPWNKMCPLWAIHISEGDDFRNETFFNHPTGGLIANSWADGVHLSVNNNAQPVKKMTIDHNNACECAALPSAVPGMTEAIPYTNITPAQSGFFLENDWAFFMGGLITVTVHVPSGASAHVSFIGQNEARGLGIGTVMVSNNGYPMNRGLNAQMDPNQLDFAIDDHYFIAGSTLDAKTPDVIIGGCDPQTKTYSIPVIPPCNGAYRMFQSYDPATGLPVKPPLHPTVAANMGCFTDSKWMAVVSHEEQAGTRWYSWDTAGLTLDPLAHALGDRVIDEPECFAAGVPTYTKGPVPYWNHNVNGDTEAGGSTKYLGSHLIEECRLCATASPRPLLAPYFGEVTWETDPRQALYEERMWKIWMDDHYRCRRASPSPSQSLKAGYPLFEIRCPNSTPDSTVTVEYRYKMFFQYITGILHPSYEQSQRNSIYDLDVEDLRLQAAPAVGSGISATDAIIDMKRRASTAAEPEVARSIFIGPAEVASIYVQPKSGISTGVNHSDSNIMSTILGGAVDFVRNNPDIVSSVAKFLFRNDGAVPGIPLEGGLGGILAKGGELLSDPAAFLEGGGLLDFIASTL